MSIANFFRRPHYKSEITQFIDELKTDKPDLESHQRAAAPCCGTSRGPQRLGHYRAGEVAQKPYVYQTDAK